MKVSFISPFASQKQDTVFAIFLTVFVFITLLVGLYFSSIQLPEISREEREKVPPQLAKLIEPKKPEPPKPEPKPEPEPEPEPEEKSEPEEKEPVKAKEVAEKAGVVKFKDELAAMRESLNLSAAKSNDLQTDGGAATEIQRNIIAGKASATSGGIQSGMLSQNSGEAGVVLASKSMATVETPDELVEQTVLEEVEPGQPRSLNAIKRIIDRNKGKIYGLYNKALRKNPDLQGNLMVEITIEPSGKVSNVKLVSSELGDKALEQKLLRRIKLIDFGEAPVSQTTFTYEFSFLPY